MSEDNGDNGKSMKPEPIQEKTPEELLAEKKKLFEEDPDKFVCIDDISVAVVRKGQNVAAGVMINLTRKSDIFVVLGHLTRHCNQLMDFMDMKRMKDQQQVNNIMTNMNNKRGFRSFLRKGK